MTVLLAVDAHVGADLSACPLDQLAAIAHDGRSGLAVIEALLTRVAAEAQRREAAGDGVVAADLVRGDGELSRQRADAINARAALGSSLPEAGAAISSGAARTENADALAATMGRLSPTERQGLAAHDAELAGRMATDNPEVFSRHLKQRATEVRDQPDPLTGFSHAEREKARSHFHMGRRFNGRWWLGGELADEWGAPVNDRIRARARMLAGDGPVTPNHLAQAVYDLITGVPDGAGGSLLGQRRMGIGYIIDAATLFADPPPPHAHTTDPTPPPAAADRPLTDAGRQCAGRGGPDRSSDSTAASDPNRHGQSASREPCSPGARHRPVAETWGGDPVDPQAIRRLACDADLYAILIGPGGEPKGAHQTHRSATRSQRLQLRALYPTCPLDNTTPFDQCEIHNVNLAHAHGGPTILANLLPLSPQWHHRVHDLGWHLTLLPDRSIEVRTPDGRLHSVVPPPSPITRQRE